MKLASIALLLFLVMGFSRPAPDCKTTIKVLNCQDKPVKGVTVTLKKCHDGTVTKKTGSDGEAVFKICKDDICDISVVTNITTTQTATGVKQDCSGSAADYTCTFKLCSPE